MNKYRICLEVKNDKQILKIQMDIKADNFEIAQIIALNACDQMDIFKPNVEIVSNYKLP